MFFVRCFCASFREFSVLESNLLFYLILLQDFHRGIMLMGKWVSFIFIEIICLCVHLHFLFFLHHLIFTSNYSMEYLQCTSHVYIPAVDFPVVFSGEPQCIDVFQWMLFAVLFRVANAWTRQPNLYISKLSLCWQSVFQFARVTTHERILNWNAPPQRDEITKIRIIN